MHLAATPCAFLGRISSNEELKRVRAPHSWQRALRANPFTFAALHWPVSAAWRVLMHGHASSAADVCCCI